MVSLILRPNRIRLCVLIAMLFGTTFYNSLLAQKQDSRKVIITTKKIDEKGNETVEKMELTGEAASEKSVEKIVKEAKKDGKSIDVEMEYTFDTEGKEIQDLLEEHGLDDEEGNIEVEIEIDEDGNMNKKVKKKEVRIIKTNNSDEEIDIDALLKEHDIILDSNSTKEIRIIKIKGDQEHGVNKREDVEEKLKKLGITLPTPSAPIANYVNAVTTSDNLVFLAGKGPKKEDGTYITGKVGKDLSVEEGYAAARRSGILQLGALKAAIGDLNRVKRIVKVLGMVNTTADFTDHPEVINGFSDLMVEVFGDRGKHARAAVGMYSLPRNIAVEIEMIVEIE